MGGPPPVTNPSLCDTPLRRNLRRVSISTGLELQRPRHMVALTVMQGVQPYVYIFATPSRSRLRRDAKFNYLTSAVTTVTAGVPWHLVRPMLRGDGRCLRLSYALLYAHHLPWPGDSPGRPSWPCWCAHVRSRTLSMGMSRGRGRVHRGGSGGQS